MTVKDLIEELQKIKDKNMRVYFNDSELSHTQITNVTEIKEDGTDFTLLD